MLRSAVGFAVGTCASLSALFAALIAVFQIIGFLRTGAWEGLSLYDFGSVFWQGTAIEIWLIAPRDWIGLSRVTHDVLVNCPLSLGLGVFAFALAYWWVTVTEEPKPT